MSELIDRQQALKALRKCQTYLYDARDPELKIELSSAEAAINNLPTVQPEPPIIKCKDCKWWRKQKDSAQGRCRLLGIYPTGAWYCADAERRTDE